MYTDNLSVNSMLKALYGNIIHALQHSVKHEVGIMLLEAAADGMLRITEHYSGGHFFRERKVMCIKLHISIIICTQQNFLMLILLLSIPLRQVLLPLPK